MQVEQLLQAVQVVRKELNTEPQTDVVKNGLRICDRFESDIGRLQSDFNLEKSQQIPTVYELETHLAKQVSSQLRRNNKSYNLLHTAQRLLQRIHTFKRISFHNQGKKGYETLSELEGFKGLMLQEEAFSDISNRKVLLVYNSLGATPSLIFASSLTPFIVQYSFISMLPAEERDILCKRYALLGDSFTSNTDVAALYKVSAAVMSGMKTKGLNQLREGSLQHHQSLKIKGIAPLPMEPTEKSSVDLETIEARIRNVSSQLKSQLKGVQADDMREEHPLALALDINIFLEQQLKIFAKSSTGQDPFSSIAQNLSNFELDVLKDKEGITYLDFGIPQLRDEKMETLPNLLVAYGMTQEESEYDLSATVPTLGKIAMTILISRIMNSYRTGIHFPFISCEAVERLIENLQERDQELLMLRFGLKNQIFHTIVDTAQQLNLTREEVLKQQQAALQKIGIFHAQYMATLK